MTKPTHRLIVAELASVPWAIRPETLERLAAVARRDPAQVLAGAAENGEPVEGAPSVTFRDGIATVRVGGPLFRYGNLFTQYCGATSYAALQRDLAAADAMRPRAIVLAIDSPGGEVRGMLDTAEAIYRMRRDDRPLVAHVDGACCSAAMLIAAACDRIVADPAAYLGCVGAMIAVDRWSEEYERDGVLSFVSSTTPLKNASALEPEGASQLQRLVDGSAEVYFAAMGRYRGVGEAVLPERYGRGAILPAADARAAGLCDEILLAEALHEALLAPPTVSPPAPPAAPEARGDAPTTPMPEEAAPMARTRSARVVAAAYEPGAAVRLTQDHEVTVAAGDEGTIVELREDTPFYAVELPDGTYGWVPEDELEAVTATAEEEEQAAEAGDSEDEQLEARARLVARRVRGAVQAARASRERQRIAALRSLDGVVARATIDAAIADPSQTAGAVALAHLQAQAKQGSRALQALADDASQIPQTPGTGTTADTQTPAARAKARAERINATRYAASPRPARS